MENRNGLIVDARLTEANGTAERSTALDMIEFLAIGAVLFGIGSAPAANAGRLFQGAGSAFAFTGAVYLATHGFPARYLATAIGFPQCFG